MIEATYVSFVPKARSEKLRQTLTEEDTAPLRWHERRTFSGSEFYFTGPAGLARKAHDYVAKWLVESQN